MLTPPFFVRPGCVSESRNTEMRIRYQWTDGRPSEVHSFETPVGTISQALVRDTFGGNHRVKYFVERAEDYKVLQYCTENSVFSNQEGSVQQTLETLGEDGVFFYRLDRSPYQKLLIELAGPERFLLDLYDIPETICELMDVLEQRLLEQLDLALGSRAQVFWLPDNITCDLTPPDAFLKYCVPYYDKVGKRCRSNGKVLLVHMDGRLRGLKDQIGGISCDVIDSFSLPEVGGDLPIGDALRLWPDKVVNPNFPASISQSPTSTIREYLESLKNEIGKRPFMLQISEDIPIETYPNVFPAISDFVCASRP